MNLNITYDQNTLNTAPSGFFSAVNYVVSLFDVTFTNNVTVNIEIGYGTFPYDNSTVPALGESMQNGLVWGNYSQTRQALINEGAPGSSTLPLSSPLSGGLVLDSAQEKALGLIGPSSALDGWVGIASDATLTSIGASWSYSATAAPGSNQYYLVGVLEHEITEVMGRTSYLDVRGEYGVMDLYRYRAPGIRQTGTGSPAYFSTDGGTTNLDNWNTLASGDIGDWAGSAGADAFLAFSPSGQIDGLSTTDITLMEALGWTMTTASINPPANYSFFATGQTVDVVTSADGNNLPAPIIGQFDLELIINGTGSYATASGYQGVAVASTDGHKLILLHGDYGVIDSGGNDSIIAGDGSVSIGGAAGDTIIGGSGVNQFIDGEKGNQSITGGSGGNETIWGAAGDTIRGGSAGNETIGGVSGDTIIGGSGGNQFIDGSKGNQSIIGGSGGNETIWGAASDTIRGGSAGNETIGGVFGETIFGGSGATIFINATGGNQSIVGGSSGNVTVWGGIGDTIRGGSDNETIGGVGGDTIIGGSGGSLFVDGDLGGQSIVGGSGGNETIWGGAGDTIRGGSGGNVIVGGVSGDTIIGGSGGNMFVNATAGNQSILGGTAGNEMIWSGAGDTIRGGSGNEAIGGVSGDTIIGGSGGNRFIDASTGNQSIIGGSGGNETIWGAVSDTIRGGSGGNETIGGVAGETIVGGSANTFIDATLGNESIVAGDGTTTVWAASGDTVQGASGTGSATIDFGVTHTAETLWDNGVTSSGSDTIYNFNQSAGDRISLSNSDSISTVVASATQNGGNTVIHLHDGSSITLVGVSSINNTFFSTH